MHTTKLKLATLALGCAIGLSGCGLLNSALSVPGRLLQSGLLPVQVVEANENRIDGEVTDRKRIAEDFTERTLAESGAKRR